MTNEITRIEIQLAAVDWGCADDDMWAEMDAAYLSQVESRLEEAFAGTDIVVYEGDRNLFGAEDKVFIEEDLYPAGARAKETIREALGASWQWAIENA